MSSELAKRLLDWYARHQRALPWRGTSDPYRIWVSEIMLQQTQVETVRPYYARWLEQFPTVEALAAAAQQAVLAAWEGLGYYSRARNLHRAAQVVATEHGGALPRSVEGLRALPGIGRYTAAAIASIAFGVDAAVLDGNVKRVLARVYDVREDVKSPAGEARLWALAESLVPPGKAGDYNQALMDLGATICTPRAPACLLCPLRELCEAFHLGVQHERPVKAERSALPERSVAAGVVWKRGRVLIAQRAAHGLLGGLWAFPAVDLDEDADASEAARARALRRALRQEWGLSVRAGKQAQTLEHGFTHFRQTLHVFDCRWQAGRLRRAEQPRKWVRPDALEEYPMGKMDRAIARRVAGDVERKA
jgi:A/G-specific adenine glycosylase